MVEMEEEPAELEDYLYMRAKSRQRTLPEGATTEHGYPILRSAFLPGDHMTIPAWIVLVSLSHNTLHPFVVWFMRDDDHQCWSGQYCKTLEEAEKTFQKRFQRELRR